MTFFEQLKQAAIMAGNVASKAAGMAVESTAGIRGKAAALAGSALVEVTEAAKRALNKTDRFSAADVDQAAEAMALSGLGLQNAEGVWQEPTPAEMRALAEVILAATLADDANEVPTEASE